MTSGKNYNSIVFLTTLYLGLVFVGATPQVLTFAALTRNFDVQNEIEVKDDLDNKPDNEEIESFTNADLSILFAQLINQIKAEVERGKISTPLQNNFYFSGVFTKSEPSGSSIRSTISDSNLSLLVQNAVNQKIKPKAFEFDNYHSEKSKGAYIIIESDGMDLSLAVLFPRNDAKQFTEFLNHEFSTKAVLAENSLIRQLYKNTEVTARNTGQVFIVTRLPRSSLDDLLAQKDAQ